MNPTGTTNFCLVFPKLQMGQGNCVHISRCSHLQGFHNEKFPRSISFCFISIKLGQSFHHWPIQLLFNQSPQQVITLTFINLTITLQLTWIYKFLFIFSQLFENELQDITQKLIEAKDFYVSTGIFTLIHTYGATCQVSSEYIIVICK